MSLPSAASSAATIDWNIVAGAIATFLVTGVASWFGLRRGKREVEKKPHIIGDDEELLTVRGGVLMDNKSMRELTHALESLEETTQRNADMMAKLWEQVVELRMDLKAFRDKG